MKLLKLTKFGLLSKSHLCLWPLGERGVFLRYFDQKLTISFFYIYCLLQLAMCRSVLLGSCPVMTGLRYLSCYFVCKRVSCGKVTASACSEFTCCQRNLEVTKVGETVFSSGTVMFCLGWDKDFPVSSVGHVLQCIQIWALATAVRTTESTITSVCYEFKMLCHSNDHWMLTARWQYTFRFSVLSATVFTNRYFFLKDKGEEVYLLALLTLALSEFE